MLKLKVKKLLTSVMLGLALITGTVSIGLGQADVVNAGKGSSAVFTDLVTRIQEGKAPAYSRSTTDTVAGLDYSSDSFKCQNGGYKVWNELVASEANGLIKEEAFKSLTAGEKQDFLKKVMKICNQCVAAADAGNGTGITTETVDDYLEAIQDKTGMGSQLLASLLAETKPDYATANQIYKPFSGPVGVILGVISILIMALLGITMAVDIAYIVIPAFQLAMGGENGEGSSNQKGGISKIISVEARNAVQAAEGGGGNSGQNGSGNKMAIGLYFKARWKGLVVLGICLLYLVSGQIYSLVSLIIDLMSGFLGF